MFDLNAKHERNLTNYAFLPDYMCKMVNTFN